MKKNTIKGVKVHYAVVYKEDGSFASTGGLKEDGKDVVWMPSIFGNIKWAKKRLSWIVDKKNYKVIEVKITPITKVAKNKVKK